MNNFVCFFFREHLPTTMNCWRRLCDSFTIPSLTIPYCNRVSLTQERKKCYSHTSHGLRIAQDSRPESELTKPSTVGSRHVCGFLIQFCNFIQYALIYKLPTLIYGQFIGLRPFPLQMQSQTFVVTNEK